MTTQLELAKRFKLLHEREGLFVIPNPWDIGSAKILQSLGFEALATTSAGLAFSLGKPDQKGAVSIEETLANGRSIVTAVSLPVSADLENGFGDDPETCAKTGGNASRRDLARQLDAAGPHAVSRPHGDGPTS